MSLLHLFRSGNDSPNPNLLALVKPVPSLRLFCIIVCLRPFPCFLASFPCAAQPLHCRCSAMQTMFAASNTSCNAAYSLNAFCVTATTPSIQLLR